MMEVIVNLLRINYFLIFTYFSKIPQFIVILSIILLSYFICTVYNISMLEHYLGPSLLCGNLLNHINLRICNIYIQN